MKSLVVTALLLTFTQFCSAQEEANAKPAELQVLQMSVGVWDAEIEVWPQGPDKASIKFKGVETNRAFGEYWLASDFESTFMGQTMKLHSIIGYDLDQKKLVGTTVDHGPYKATMTGVYDKKANAVTWTTKAKMPDGTPMIQSTVITQRSPTERVLILNVPAMKEGDFTKFMQIRFVKRK